MVPIRNTMSILNRRASDVERRDFMKKNEKMTYKNSRLYGMKRIKRVSSKRAMLRLFSEYPWERPFLLRRRIFSIESLVDSRYYFGILKDFRYIAD